MAKRSKPPLKTPSDSKELVLIEREKRSAVIQLLAKVLPNQPFPEEGPEYTELMERLIRQCTVLVEMVYCAPSGHVLAHAYQLFKKGEVLGGPSISKRLVGVGWKGASERSVTDLLGGIRKELKSYLDFTKVHLKYPGTVDTDSRLFLTETEFSQVELFVSGKSGYETRAILEICHNKDICPDSLWQRIPATTILSGATDENRDAPRSVNTYGRVKAELMRMRDALESLLVGFSSGLKGLREALKDSTDPKRAQEIIEQMSVHLDVCSRMVERFDANRGPEITFKPPRKGSRMSRGSNTP